MKRNRFLQSFCALAAFGVLSGAFGAHALKARVSEADLEIWKTATFYLLVHCLSGMMALGFPVRQRAATLFGLGAVIFSFSLYALVLSGFKILGAITPLGGVCMILGWIFLAWDLGHSKAQL